MNVPPELIPPSALFEKIRFPGWNIRVSIDQEPRVLRRLVAFPEKETCLKRRDEALANARSCLILERKARAAARKQ